MRFSCEPQRLRGPTEALEFQCQTLPEVDWNALWLVSCNRLLDGTLGWPGSREQAGSGESCEEPVANVGARLEREIGSTERVREDLGNAAGRICGRLDLARTSDKLRDLVIELISQCTAREQRVRIPRVDDAAYD